MKKQTLVKRTIRPVLLVMAIIMLLCSFPIAAFASSSATEVVGKVYEFDGNSKYEFHESDTYQESNGDNTYGTFCINGDIVNVGNKNGIPSYEIGTGSLGLFYNHADTLLNADEESWHLVDDKTKKVADMTLDSNIMKGVIMVQTSRDRLNWVNVESIYNAFSDTPVRSNSIYTTTDMQLNNGCYYRIIVAYKISINPKGLFNTDYKKLAEVYEFHAYASGGQGNTYDPNQTYRLGEKVKVADFDSYSGEQEIDKNDMHYGWDIGQFFVSGYTDEVVKTGENVVFLKNVGDRVTLWFDLQQDINKLNGNDKLSVTADEEGSDQYFQTTTTNFGRGALIVRHTDYNNVKSDPIIYTNFLEANTSVDANTVVDLFEEGDYEVALDYEVTEVGFLGIPTTRHYRIFFKFSVRNGNCMVYPFDVRTGSELNNSSMTENGFRLDLANSRYLKIVIKREVLNDSADGLVEDTRFNRPARDGEEYTQDGIYTITVTNEYTGATTVKKIYVGTNKILRAHVKTKLSIPEINDLVLQGATILEDGTIDMSTMYPINPDIGNSDTGSNDNNPDTGSNDNNTENTGDYISIKTEYVILIGVAVIVIIIVLVKRR